MLKTHFSFILQVQAGSFIGSICEKVCESKSGLSRHMNTHDNEPNLAKITPEVIENLLSKVLDKIKNGDLYNQTLHAEAQQCTLPCIEDLTLEINKMKMKTPEKFSTVFYGKIMTDPLKYLAIKNRPLAVILLSKLCTLLLGVRKEEKKEPIPSFSGKIISEREMAGLQYLAGFILHRLYKNLEQSSSCKKVPRNNGAA